MVHPQGLPIKSVLPILAAATWLCLSVLPPITTPNREWLKTADHQRTISLASSFVSSPVSSLSHTVLRQDDKSKKQTTTPDSTIENSIGMKLVPIPAGSFVMGSAKDNRLANDDEKPAHEVKISKSFHLGMYEVTQSEYEKVTGENPSFFSTSGTGKNRVAGINTSAFPVERITWQEAKEFCRLLSALPQEKKAGRVYRLPSEAEWEYACRGGTTTQYHFGNQLTSKLANFNGKLPTEGAAKGPFIARPTSVGSYQPNAFGLFDMHGNVWEWCADGYHPNYYERSPKSDPTGFEASADRCIRGGSWADDALNCRSAYRFNLLAVRGFQTRGFRVVMTVSKKEKEETSEPKSETLTADTKRSKEAAERERVFQADIVPFLKSYCLDCHSGQDSSGDVVLDTLDRASTITSEGHKSWKKVVDVLRANRMPPDDSKQPPRVQSESISQWIATTLSKIDCTGVVDPGHETIRRLNRAEYRNTVRDLMGIDYRKASEFPTDDVGATGDTLSLPPLLMERYLSAAEEISSQVIKRETACDRPAKNDHRVVIVRPNEKISRRQATWRTLAQLGNRAFRRPITDVELERLIRLTDGVIERGGSYEEGMGVAIQAILVSPHFLFRVEAISPQATLETVEPLSEYELATRLSYFLWSSMPDDPLFEHASKKSLRKNLKQQIRRMLADPKSQALVQDFASSWLQLNQLQSVQPDLKRFPEFDNKLRQAMRQETEHFLAAIVREDRSLLDLIDADFTFVNDRLARHYGIERNKGGGEKFRRISIADTNRRGLVAQASILTLTSNPTRTSPVKRGKWILENLLDAPPPDPPAGVSNLAETSGTDNKISLRRRLEIHRNNPKCASCHEPMDSLGFGLENFDAIGRWRNHDEGAPIDASGSLSGSDQFTGPQQLTSLLRKHRGNEFVRCLVRKMLAYALGRELDYFDHCTVNQIVAALAKNDYRFSTLIDEIVSSDAFQKNRPKTIKR